VRLAADANVLLSAVIGGRAKLILEHPKVEEVLTTEPTLAEVEEYALVLAKKKHLPVDTLILAVASLPVTIVERSQYLKRLPRALRLIRHRDPDDSELLALALQFRIPVWSNDRDFEDVEVEVFTTEHLLREFGLIQ